MILNNCYYLDSNSCNNFLFQMIKINSKEDNNFQNILDKGFISEKVNEDKRMNDLNNRVNSMIKSQSTQSQSIS